MLLELAKPSLRPTWRRTLHVNKQPMFSRREISSMGLNFSNLICRQEPVSNPSLPAEQMFSNPIRSFYCSCCYQHIKHWRRAEGTAQQVIKSLATHTHRPDDLGPDPQKPQKSQAWQCMSVNSALVWQGGRQRQENPCSCCLPTSAQRPMAQESPPRAHQSASVDYMKQQTERPRLKQGRKRRTAWVWILTVFNLWQCWP